MSGKITFVDRHGCSHELSDPTIAEDELRQIVGELAPLQPKIIRADEPGDEAVEAHARDLLARCDELRKFLISWDAAARQSVVDAISIWIAAFEEEDAS